MKILFYMLSFISPPFPHTQKHTLTRLKNVKTLISLLSVDLLFTLLLLEPAFAGGPPIQWQKTFGGSNPDEGRSVEQTTDGGYIITGFTSSFGPIDANVYLIKTDSNGILQWQKTFGGSANDFGYSVQQTFDGGYIIAGYTTSYGTVGDVYLIKTDPNGDLQWQKTFGSSNHDYGLSVQQTTDNGYIIAGYTYPPTAEDMDVYLIKTDPNGNSQWQKTFGGSNYDRGIFVLQISDGGYIIVGHTSSYGASGDIYLIKTDPNGISIWQKTLGGSGPDGGNSIQQTLDGGYIIVGSTYSFGAGKEDVYLVKTDPNGNLQWQKTFGGSNYDRGISVHQTSDGGYIVTGHVGAISSGPIRGADVYLIKTDPNGNSQWQQTFGESNYNDIAYSAQQTADGGYVIAGHTDSYGAGWSDVYLIKTCSDGTLSADFNCNGTVYYEDLTILADEWLQPPVMLSADIFPEFGDSIVNGFDFAALTNNWLQTTAP